MIILDESDDRRTIKRCRADAILPCIQCIYMVTRSGWGEAGSLLLHSSRCGRFPLSSAVRCRCSHHQQDMKRLWTAERAKSDFTKVVCVLPHEHWEESHIRCQMLVATIWTFASPLYLHYDLFETRDHHSRILMNSWGRRNQEHSSRPIPAKVFFSATGPPRQENVATTTKNCNHPPMVWLLWDQQFLAKNSMLTWWCPFEMTSL